MRGVAFVLVAVSAIVLAVTWLGYPMWLRLRARRSKQLAPLRAAPHAWWPSVTIIMVVHNAEKTLRSALNNLISLAYPVDRRRILVVSDASTDFSDAIARSFAHRGVDLLRVMRRQGNARAANYARKYVRSDLVVVLDPDARLFPAALAALVAPFADPTVGVAYGHEVPAREFALRSEERESPFRRYETSLRDAESRVFGTVSARRTLYAMRGPLYHAPVPPWLSPDFMLTLLAREHGYRAVHVNDARTVMSRELPLGDHYTRVVRNVGRDVLTLLLKPRMLNPRRYGAFAMMLIGHKLGRWLTPWLLLAGLAGLLVLAPSTPWARVALGIIAAGAAGAFALALVAARTEISGLAALPGRLAATTVAMAHASVKAMRAASALKQEA